uniref:small monomeric GTPase n=1 Tax=Canis lupus familiaris TaxID=9615 RepID=A0A8C0NKZ7_CANLF
MRLIQNMCTIAEYPAPGSAAAAAAAADCCAGAAGRRLVKIAVVGASGVGKTALVVRFLTKRFIGDYERNAGNLYTRQVQIEGETLAIQVQDTPGIQVHENGLSCGEQLNRCIRWADAVVIVFSITDYKSYELIGQLHQHVQQLHLGTRLPVVVVANKADLLHVKQVDPQLGLQLASVLGCSFYEVSCQRKLQRRLQRFPRLVQGSESQTAAQQHTREAENLPHPQAQVPQHAGPQEEVQASPLGQKSDWPVTR